MIRQATGLTSSTCIEAFIVCPWISCAYDPLHLFYPQSSHPNCPAYVFDNITYGAH